VGDPRYNEEKYNRNIEKFYGPLRLQLHAEKLNFKYKGQDKSFSSPIDFDLFFKET
jgi:23S rRNA-/tRNA-specific pseudouridylate synthase